jgi:hypothetical protein
MPLLPLMVKFRWLEPKGGNRWARWLLWAMVIPGEIVALTFVYFGPRPLLVGTPVLDPIDELMRIVVDHVIVAILVVICVVLAIAFRIRSPMHPLSRAHKAQVAQVPPELTYEHWRERQKQRAAEE